MPKRKSYLDKYTWIVTELVIGLVAIGYGLYATIDSLPNPNVVFVIITSLGALLTLIAIGQIILVRKKKVKKFCAKCGEKVKKEDEFCAKCGEEIS